MTYIVKARHGYGATSCMLASYHPEMEEQCVLENSSIYRQDVTLTVCRELLESGYKAMHAQR